MPKIAQSNRTNGHMVFEDPRPGNATIYLQTHAHEMTSLSPLFGKYLSTDTDGSNVAPQGHPGTTSESLTQFGADLVGHDGSMLQLTKDTLHVYHSENTSSNNPYEIYVFSFCSVASSTNIPICAFFLSLGVTFLSNVFINGVVLFGPIS